LGGAVKGDFSRFVVDPDQYSRVFMQQGRVMVDSDWNDLVAIVTGAQRLFAADVIGPHGGPSADLAYHVELIQGGNQPDLGCAADPVGQQPRPRAGAGRPDVVAADPCVSSPDAQYRGPEKQRYRVEIHAVEGGGPTFVWSRENGSVVAAWLATDGDDLHVNGE